MSELETRANQLLKEFKGGTYAFGNGILDSAPGDLSAQMGKKALFVGPVNSEWFNPYKERIQASLRSSDIDIVGVARSAAPNAPFVDVYRIHSHISPQKTRSDRGGRRRLGDRCGQGRGDHRFDRRYRAGD